MVDFADGSTYNMHPKFLSLVEEEGTSKAAKAAKKQKTSASACQVRRERNTAGANVTRTGCSNQHSAIHNI